MSPEVKEQDGVPIAKELLTPDGYRWFVFDENTTGMTIVGLEDMETGVIVSTPLANPRERTASLIAWSGARQSRSPGKPWQIARELVEKGVNVDKKIEDTVTVKSYGHKSGGDMAHLVLQIVDAPMHYYWTLFYLSSVCDGQEKSTRFQQAFGRSSLPELKLYLPSEAPISEEEYKSLEAKYLGVEDESRRLFLKWKDRLTAEFVKHYEVDMGDPAQKGALNARVLDCARKFLLLGFSGGQHFGDWASDLSTNVVAALKGSPIDVYKKFGNQIQRLLTPTEEEERELGFLAEAPGLIKHTEPSGQVAENINNLNTLLRETDFYERVSPPRHSVEARYPEVELLDEKFHHGERMLAQAIMAANIGLDSNEVLEWVHEQDDSMKSRMSSTFFAWHTNHVLMDSIARTTGLTLKFGTNIAVDRDLNRHRPWGRFIEMMGPILYSKGGILNILGRGFTVPRYLTDVDNFLPLGSEYAEDMKGLFGKVSEFIGASFAQYGKETDLTAVLNLLPLGLYQEIFMSGDPMQASYMTNQRARPGGDIDYTVLAWDANKLIAESDPTMAGIAIVAVPALLERGIDLSKRPDPGDRTLFLDRS